MLYLGYLLLRYVLIYNLEVPFYFHLSFLQLCACLHGVGDPGLVG